MSDFEVRTATEAGRTVVSVIGECDLRHRDALTSSLQEAVQSAPLVVVDLARVPFLDSSGLYALVAAHHAARGRAGHLHVVNATGSVRTVLQLTGVLKLLQPPAPPDGVSASTPDPA